MAHDALDDVILDSHEAQIRRESATESMPAVPLQTFGHEIWNDLALADIGKSNHDASLQLGNK